MIHIIFISVNFLLYFLVHNQSIPKNIYFIAGCYKLKLKQQQIQHIYLSIDQRNHHLQTSIKNYFHINKTHTQHNNKKAQYRMSVYSGFATRNQQSKYNYLLQTLIITLKKRIIKFYSNQQCDESKFKLLIKKIYKKMFLLQKGKFAPPKYTSCFTDLIHSLHIDINYETLSDVSSSKISQTFSLTKSRHDSGGNNYNDFGQDETMLKSRNILQSKRNLLLESQKSNNLVATLNVSALSLKKPYFSTVNVEENQQKLRIVVGNQGKINRSSSLGLELDPLNALKQRIKFRKLQDLKSLRGTVHMPKMEDFLPKKEQLLQTNLYKHSPQTLQPPRQPRGGYRRQKYTRAEVNIQQI